MRYVAGDAADEDANLVVDSLTSSSVEVNGDITAATVTANTMEMSNLIYNNYAFNIAYGTFTPALKAWETGDDAFFNSNVAPTINYSRQIGKYWRMGEMLWIYFDVKWTQTGTPVQTIGVALEETVPYNFTAANCRFSGKKVLLSDVTAPTYDDWWNMEPVTLGGLTDSAHAFLRYHSGRQRFLAYNITDGFFEQPYFYAVGSGPLTVNYPYRIKATVHAIKV